MPPMIQLLRYESLAGLGRRKCWRPQLGIEKGGLHFRKRRTRYKARYTWPAVRNSNHIIRSMSKFTVSRLANTDVLLVQPRKVDDPRGYFMETYSRKDFEQLGIVNDFVQDNESLSTQPGTIRGLHFQVPPHPQAKLVRVLKGAIFDVAIDLRRGSPAFGKWCAATLTAAQREQLLIPRGFAHAFCTLEPDTEVAYKVDDYYTAECDAGIIWNDPDIDIDWPVTARHAILSEKDASLPRLSDFESPFTYTERK